tara:strand:+ start:57 stop:242 length:186 start_codon:yes stop_codon:yes gene_type:complete
MDKMPNKAKRKIAMMKIKNAAKSAFSQNKKPKRLYKESNQFGTKDSGYKYYSSGGNVFKGR